MGFADETTVTSLGPLGCGRFSRERLELLALGAEGIDADPQLEAHVVRCAECSAAVRAIESDNALLLEATTTARAAAEQAASSDGPIPGYTLLEEIHRGGQGAVFRAEQVATRRECAVKMLLGGRFAGERERQRFDREVEVVAHLRHPSIVTLYESGRSRVGEPWFAMELVDGERIDARVERTQLDPLATARLVREVAAGVAHAHRRGVIHRDLKPSNVLVDRDGVPRVLDFGVARSDATGVEEPEADGTTRRGEFVGTYAYAAPEQLLGDPSQVDSRCDLYALGVILFECLTGRRPFEGIRSIGELVAAKSGGVFPRPSSLRAGIPKDLEVIVLRLLAPDPSRRYDTADALVEDLDRLLDGRPILARDDSLAYVVSKTLRRHWIATSAGAGFTVALAVAGVALVLAYANARAERARAERTLRTFQEVLETTNPELGMGTSDMRVLDFIRLVEAGLDEALAGDPLERAEVLRTIGLIHLGFSSVEDASRPIERAYELQRRAFEEGTVAPERMAAAALALARLRYIRSADDPAVPDFEASERLYREALLLRERSLGRDHVDTVDALRQLSSALRRQREFDDAERCLDDATSRLARLPESRPVAVQRAAVLNARGAIANARGRLDVALSAYSEALAAVRLTVPEDDFRIGVSLFNIARVQAALGMRTEALVEAREAVRILGLRKGADAMETRAVQRFVDRLAAESGAEDAEPDSPAPPSVDGAATGADGAAKGGPLEADPSAPVLDLD